MPQHIDFVSALAAGVLTYETLEDEEKYLAVDKGVLVKVGDEVLVSSRRAIEGVDLGELSYALTEQFREINEREEAANHAMLKLEAGIIRRFAQAGRVGS